MIYPVTIASSGSVSSTVTINPGEVPVAIEMPAAWTAAVLTFKSGASTLNNLYTDLGSEVTAIAAASETIALYWPDFVSLAETKNLAIRSGTAATPVAQSAARTLYLITQPLTMLAGGV